MKHKVAMALGAALILAGIAALFYALVTNADMGKYSPPIIAFVTWGALLVLKSEFPSVSLAELKAIHSDQKEQKN
jgi:hypothetical protein